MKKITNFFINIHRTHVITHLVGIPVILLLIAGSALTNGNYVTAIIALVLVLIEAPHAIIAIGSITKITTTVKINSKDPIRVSDKELINKLKTLRDQLEKDKENFNRKNDESDEKPGKYGFL